MTERWTRQNDIPISCTRALQNYNLLLNFRKMSSPSLNSRPLAFELCFCFVLLCLFVCFFFSFQIFSSYSTESLYYWFGNQKYLFQQNFLSRPCHSDFIRHFCAIFFALRLFSMFVFKYLLSLLASKRLLLKFDYTSAF